MRGRDNKTWDEWTIRSGKRKKEGTGWLRDRGGTAPASHFTLLATRMHSKGHVWLYLSPSSSNLSLSVSYLWRFGGWMPAWRVKPHSRAVKMEWMFYYQRGEDVCAGKCSLTTSHIRTQKKKSTPSFPRIPIRWTDLKKKREKFIFLYFPLQMTCVPQPSQ